jgi:Holliday junction resolvase RusA-like endonuclease
LAIEDPAMSTITFTIQGQCVSSKNSKIQTIKNGKPLVFNNPDLERFKKSFLLQVPPEARQHLHCRVAVTIDAYYDSDRSDLEVEVIYDLLQAPKQIGRYMRKGAGVIDNDRQIVAKISRKFIDPQQPRVVIKIEPVAWERSGKQVRLLDDEAARPEVGAIV